MSDLDRVNTAFFATLTALVVAMSVHAIYLVSLPSIERVMLSSDAVVRALRLLV